MTGGSQKDVPGMLLLYHRPLFGDAATIEEHIGAFGRHSRFPVHAVNTDLGFPSGLAARRYQAIVLHYSLFASGAHPYLLDEGTLEYLNGADAYKVAFFQDEHQYCTKRFAFLDEHSIDCVYTCFEPRYFEATYGKYTRVPKLVSHVPAYVSEGLVAAATHLRVPEERRSRDIGYRARPMPPYVGRGGLEKVEIATGFSDRAEGLGLRLDLSTAEEDRIYGKDWYRFVASSIGFLGTESGVSCSDLEDEVREEYERLSEDGHEVTIDELEQGALGKWDWLVPLRTTSSRHFEAAAFGTCQIMFEGEYSGALRPMEHYIPLKKDFSNFDEVIERFRDREVRDELTANARRDLIDSGAHSYRAFIAGFDRTLMDAGMALPAASVPVPRPLPAFRGRPAKALASRYAGGVWFWLWQKHPRIWNVLNLASKPLTAPYWAIKGALRER